MRHPRARFSSAALDAEQQAAFTQELLALMESRNCSGDRTLVLPSEYLEVVIEARRQKVRTAGVHTRVGRSSPTRSPAFVVGPAVADHDQVTAAENM